MTLRVAARQWSGDGPGRGSLRKYVRCRTDTLIHVHYREACMMGSSPRSNEISRRYWRHSSLSASLGRLPVATPSRAQAKTLSRAARRSRTRRENNAEVRVREDHPAARVASQERLFRLYGSALTSFLASQGIDIEEGERTFQARARAFLASRCRKVLGIDFEDWIAQVVAVKVKRYSTGVNVPSEDEESETSDAVDRNATDYFKASRGE